MLVASRRDSDHRVVGFARAHTSGSMDGGLPGVAGRTGRYANPEPDIDGLIQSLMDPAAREARARAALDSTARGRF
jgi:hypothetical protein